MKQMLLAAITFICLPALAQPTITASYFPVAGDTLRSAIFQEPNGAYNSLITAPGGPFNWDLSSLPADNLLTTIYKNASEGANFAQFNGADVMIAGDQSETYFNKTNTAFQAMGYAGADPGGFGLDIVAKFEPFVTERKAPLNLFDFSTTSTDLSLPFGTDQLPDSLFQGLPISFDSLRVRISTDRNEIANGYGKVTLAGYAQPFDVLRVERTEFTTTGLDIKVPFLGWIDISTFLGGGGGGGGIGDFLGVDTTITHRFYANDVKEEVAVFTLSNDEAEVTGIRYKTALTSSTDDPGVGIAPGSPSVSSFPNPAVDWVRFDYFNLPEDNYNLKIYSLIGNPVWDKSYRLSGSKNFRIDLDNFRKGTYLYSFADSKGKIIATKRLVVVKP
jgi:hypothetical protein